MNHTKQIILSCFLFGLLQSSFYGCKEKVEPVVLSDKKELLSFVIDEIEGIIDDSDKTISFNLPDGTNLSSLTPEISVSPKATSSPASNVAQDFTQAVTYQVSAEDGSSVEYVVTVVDACASDLHIHNFTYDGKTYELIKLNRRWGEAASCAVERGGYLAEINDEAENAAILQELNNANINLDNSVGTDGGLATYIWLGGNDQETEGAWIWDGNNDQTGLPFWLGDASGEAIDDRYTNWGNEPDNFSGQDGLGLALTQWPVASGSLGSAGQWNDIKLNNSLYFLVEFD